MATLKGHTSPPAMMGISVKKATSVGLLVAFLVVCLLLKISGLESSLKEYKAKVDVLEETAFRTGNNGGGGIITATIPSTSKSSSNGWQPKSSAIICPTPPVLLPKMHKSQFAEDKMLMRWFKNICNGSYLEMGALDGINFSNTHVFHKGMGWKGVLLEASPENFEKLKVNRPDDTLIHAGICGHPGDLHWVEGRWDSTGGFWEFASEVQKNKFFRRGGYEKAKLVKCDLLSKILEEKVGTNLFFDFYTLDIEGAEYAALQTIDFSKVAFGIIVIEASGQNVIKDTAVRTLLEANGYRHHRIEEAGPQWFESDWFINKDWQNIYRDLIYA